MKICSTKQNGVLYIKLVGELDEHNAAAVRKEADSLVERYAQSERAVFDLGEVSFMDSTGIGFLIGRYKKLLRFGVQSYIMHPSQNTDKILSMSGVYSLIPKI